MDFPYLNVDFLQGKNFMPLINDWKKNLNQTKEPQTWGTKPTLFWGEHHGDRMACMIMHVTTATTVTVFISIYIRL